MTLARLALYGVAGFLLGIAVVRLATAHATPHPADAVIVSAPQPPP